jgi:hypothetical protein
MQTTIDKIRCQVHQGNHSAVSAQTRATVRLEQFDERGQLEGIQEDWGFRETKESSNHSRARWKFPYNERIL